MVIKFKMILDCCVPDADYEVDQAKVKEAVEETLDQFMGITAAARITDYSCQKESEEC